MPNVWTDGRLVSAQEMSRLSAAIAGTYVFPTASGGAVTSNSNMAPSVAAITANTGLTVNGTADSTGFAGGTVTVTTADGTNPRRDWIWYDGAGAVGVTAGTPAASPVLPDLTAGRIGFYEVYVAANDTSIDTGDLIDRRANNTVTVNGKVLIARSTSNFTKNNNTTLGDITGLAFSIAASEVWAFECWLQTLVGATPDIKFAFTVPAGAAGTGGIQRGADSGGSLNNIRVTDWTASNASTGIGTQNTQVLFGTIVNSTTAGTVQLQAAQNTADVSDTIIYAQSYIRATRIA